MSNIKMTQPFHRPFTQRKGVPPTSASGCTPWSVVSSPNVGTGNNILAGVSAISTDNIWAVGWYVNSSGIDQTLIEHWNGTSWQVVTSPNVGSGDNRIGDVVAVSTDNIWAVGWYVNSSDIDQTLIEHWNGTSWQVVTSPNGGMDDNQMTGLVAVTGNNIWATGGYQNSSGTWQTLIEHWNGTSWSVVPSPSTGPGDNFLVDVAAVSTDNIWAVGYYHNSGGMQQTLIEHWDGRSWSIVPSPNPGWSDNELWGITAISAQDLWAVGAYGNGTIDQTLVEHWNGHSWRHIPSESVGPSDSQLYAVTHVPGTQTPWAVGLGMDNKTLTTFSC